MNTELSKWHYTMILPEGDSSSVREIQMSIGYAISLPNVEKRTPKQRGLVDGLPRKYHSSDPTWGIQRGQSSIDASSICRERGGCA